MPSATDIHGQVFRDGSATLLARAVGGTGSPLVQADVASAQYTVYLLDEKNPDTWTPVTGHTNVSVPIDALIFDTLQTDNLWTVDATGYNFRHVLDVSAQPAFAIAGQSYLIVFELTPTIGQVILLRFRLKSI